MYAHKLQELLGGAYGEMTIAMALFDEEYAEHAITVWHLDHLLVGHGLMAHKERGPRSDAVGRRHVAYRIQRG